MKTLFLAWQDRGPKRAWYPIGRLEADVPASHYEFRYTKGAESAQREAGFPVLPAFPDLHRRYESSELFPLFQNRVLDSRRKDFTDYLRWLDLSPNQGDPIEILAVSGGQRQTDSLEVFPKIMKRADGSFVCRFFLHGIRHASKPAQERATQLREDESLRIAVELNNPATGVAIQLCSEDYQMLGWTPRYLVGDLVQAVAHAPVLQAKVVQVNEAGVPLNQRVLVEFSGSLPEGAEPMSSEPFQPLG